MVNVPGTAIERRANVVDRCRLPGDDHRAITVAHAGAAGAKNILVGQIGVGVQADGRQFQLAGKGAAVERFDVDQLVLEGVAAGIDFSVGQGMKHEGVVRIGTVADADSLPLGAERGGSGHFFRSLLTNKHSCAASS